MKYLKMLGLAAVAAMALTAFTAGSASATTLEVGGVAQNASVSLVDPRARQLGSAERQRRHDRRHMHGI